MKRAAETTLAGKGGETLETAKAGGKPANPT
jgi:hypothetical protein